MLLYLGGLVGVHAHQFTMKLWLLVFAFHFRLFCEELCSAWLIVWLERYEAPHAIFKNIFLVSESLLLLVLVFLRDNSNILIAKQADDSFGTLLGFSRISIYLFYCRIFTACFCKILDYQKGVLLHKKHSFRGLLSEYCLPCFEVRLTRDALPQALWKLNRLQSLESLHLNSSSDL